jgi:pyrroline-5-carboxylate reductase
MILGFLGSGKMASALAGGVINSGGVKASDVVVSDVFAPAAEKLAKATGAIVAATNSELAEKADAIVLCVKPSDALEAVRGISPKLKGKLVISIVAALDAKSLESAAGPGVRVVRVMPNTPALVGEGASAYSLGSTATEDDARLVEKILSGVGLAVRVKESLLDAVTGLSGSGPAYVFTVIEALADGGVLMGLPRELALKLATQTVIGAARMVRETGEHPGVLRDQVASPGGTTIAAIEALEDGGLRSALISAVRAATERSRELR